MPELVGRIVFGTISGRVPDIRMHDIPQARASFECIRDMFGFTMHELRGMQILRDDIPVAWMSYNGRLWADGNYPTTELNDDLTMKGDAR